MIALLLVVAGLTGLWLGTELTLRHTIALAERRGLSQGLLGLTVLAVGTDLPELLIAINGGIQQLRGAEASGIVVGNAIGSAITQGSLVLGIAGLLGHLRLAPSLIRRDGLVLAVSVALFLAVGFDRRITRTEGLVLVLAYGLYFALLVQRMRARAKPPPGTTRPRNTALGIFGGLLVILLSAELVVANALQLVERWSLDQTVVGVLLIGAGTSLPELALSLGAAARGRTGLSVGNIIGSNVFDLLVPVGVSALLHPLAIDTLTLVLDLPFLLVVVAGGLGFFVRRRGLQRGEAILLVAAWVAFVVARLLLAPGYGSH